METNMMGRLDPDPIPKWAVTCWTDDQHVYVALPMTAGGIPYIMKWPLNEGGLSQALLVLRKRQKEVLEPTRAAPANHTRQPMVKLDRHHEKLKQETTESQRESARKLLEKLGIKS
jgi:hypothetical protein